LRPSKYSKTKPGAANTSTKPSLATVENRRTTRGSRNLAAVLRDLKGTQLKKSYSNRAPSENGKITESYDQRS
jgi:hypothetical protein